MATIPLTTRPSQTPTQPSDSSPVLTFEHLESLAKTYDRSAQPVWVHDMWARCVYRNNAAMDTSNANTASIAFDLLDHYDRKIGLVTTQAG